MLEDKILNSIAVFCRNLREMGIGGSLSEELDAMEALTLVPWDTSNFKAALASTLVKDKEKLPLFNIYFDYYFGLSGYLDHPSKESTSDCLETTDEVRNQSGNSMSHSPERFIQYCTLGDKIAVKSTLRSFFTHQGREILKASDTIDEALRRIIVILEWKKVEYSFEDKCLTQSVSWEDVSEIFEEEWQHMLVDVKCEEGLRWSLERVNLKELSFYTLSKNQIWEMKQLIQTLAKKIRRKGGRSLKVSRKGLLSLRNTLKKSFRVLPCIALQPQYVAPHKPRMKLVILCDISGSMALFSEFTLQLIYTLHSCFKTIDSYIFVDSVELANHYFRGSRVEESLRRLYNEHKVSLTGFSNYGQVIQAFHKNYTKQLSKDSILLVLGDGRSNYQPLEVDLWWNIAKQVKCAYWLNPAPKYTWNKEDSMVSLLTKNGYNLRECTNMRQLEKVFLEIFTR